MPAVIDAARCNGCGLCIPECKGNAIHLNGSKMRMLAWSAELVLEPVRTTQLTWSGKGTIRLILDAKTLDITKMLTLTFAYA